jgi:hypothetical protein
MELTYSCKNCGTVGCVAPLENALQTTCRHCGATRAIEASGCAGGELQFCPVCSTEELYIQKDFPKALGLLFLFVGFAISTVFWYYEMPLLTYLVLIISIALDFLLYYRVKDVTICYRCQSQIRGKGSNPAGRFKAFDLGIGERYRQERIRAEQIRESSREG